MADHGPSAADSKAQAAAAGKPDPGLKFVREITMTREQEQQLEAQARANIPGIAQQV